jgi:hypothetical protein
MMTVDDTLRRSAGANALSSIRKGARFPHNVFTHKWDGYLFFESYRMFDNDFIELKNIALAEEGSSYVALANLGNTPSGSEVEPSFQFLTKDTVYSEYLSILKGDGSALNWMFLMDRYVCTSDKTNWCIYCEKENDIAVLAVRHTLSTSFIQKLRNLLNAESITAIRDSKAGRPFDFDTLVPSWQSALMAEYGH